MEQRGLFIIEGSPLKITKTYPFRAASFNDIHVASQFGLTIEKGWVDRYGARHMPNRGQTILNGYVNDYAEKCREFKVNHLWVVGDTVIGQNYYEKGKYVVNIELEEQKMMAAKVISDFVEKVGTIEKVFLWRSTGYHGSYDTSIDKNIADILKAEYNINAEYRGEYSIMRLVYGKFRKNIFITHPASDAVMYPEQAMGKDMMLWQEAVGNKKLPPIDVILRAHKHTAIEVHKPNIRAIQLPCWQWFVPYDSAMKNYARWQPDIGGNIFLFDEQLRMTTYQFIYPNVIEPYRYIDVVLDKGVEEACLL